MTEDVILDGQDTCVIKVSTPYLQDTVETVLHASTWLDSDGWTASLCNEGISKYGIW